MTREDGGEEPPSFFPQDGMMRRFEGEAEMPEYLFHNRIQQAGRIDGESPTAPVQ